MITTIFDAIIKSERRGRGAAGEMLAQDLLCRAGYVVQKHALHTKRGDLRAIHPDTGEFWDVEVKTAKRRDDGKWCFQLIKTGHTDYRHSHYVMLIAVIPGGKTAHYLIPVSTLERRGMKTITISNLNAGIWSQYRVKGLVRL